MDTDTGLIRKLPPPPEDNPEDIDVKQRNIFEVLDNILMKSHRGDDVPADHSFWALYFGYFSRKRNIKMMATLPNIGSILRQGKKTSELPKINED